jgi:hypothetical protein
MRGAVYTAVDIARPGDPDPASKARLSGVIDGPHKLIREEHTGALRLFDLVADPSELHDISRDRPRIAAQLEARLDAWAAESARRAVDQSIGQLSTEDIDVLRGLGYLGR